MKKRIISCLAAGGLLLGLLLQGCQEKTPAEQETSPEERELTEVIEEDPDTEEGEEMVIKVQISDRVFDAELESNPGAEAFYEMVREEPVTVSMSDYGGFEKVGSLGKSLPTQNRQTATQPGDIVLYNGNQIVVFYGSNSWSYTRLARARDLTGWENALGKGSVEVTFSAE